MYINLAAHLPDRHLYLYIHLVMDTQSFLMKEEELEVIVPSCKLYQSLYIDLVIIGRLCVNISKEP